MSRVDWMVDWETIHDIAWNADGRQMQAVWNQALRCMLLTRMGRHTPAKTKLIAQISS